MIYYKVLIAIREGHGLSQKAFADMLGCSVDYIRALEGPSKNRDQVTPEFLNILREKLDLHDAPLTVEEKDQFMEELHRWKDLIDYGEIRKATALKPELAKRAKSSFRQGLLALHSIYEAAYYFAVGKPKAFKDTMSYLETLKQGFSERCNVLYYQQQGAFALWENRLFDAQVAFIKAEEMDKKSKYSSMIFNYNYGLCLSYMGYATRAIEYLKKAQYKAKWDKNHEGRANRRYAVHIEGELAQNFSKLGNTDEALLILNNRLNYEMSRSKPRYLGFVYHDFGRVYHRMGKIREALENYYEAFKYHEEGSVPYLNNTYHKTKALIANGRICEAMDYVNKGLNMSNDEIWKVLFDALKHSLSLSNPESREHIIMTAIPNLIRHNQDEEVMDHYKKLSEFYEKNGDSDKALQYNRLALDIYEKLYKKCVERGLCIRYSRWASSWWR